MSPVGAPAQVIDVARTVAVLGLVGAVIAVPVGIMWQRVGTA